MLTVEGEGENITVTGNNCPRGAAYAKKELTDPRRIVTSTVEVIGGKCAVVPVKTKEAVPKELIFECMKEINSLSVHAPVAIGDVLLTNIAGTGIELIATKNV